MACPWEMGYGEPDPETRQVTCRCRACGKFADLDCERDFASGMLVVQVMTCVAKGGTQAVYEKPKHIALL
jgi:hypothetical protein